MDIGEPFVAIHGIQPMPQLSVDPWGMLGMNCNRIKESCYLTNVSMMMVII